MTALGKDRATVEIMGELRTAKVAATTTIYAGAIVMRNASGYAVKGQTATNLRGIGCADHYVKNDGSAGDASINYCDGIFKFFQTGTAFTEADIGKVVYAVDDQTVAKDSGTGTRSPAGFLWSIASDGVFVEFDESKLTTWQAATA